MSEDKMLVGRIDGEKELWLPASELPLVGSHNVANALAAATAARLAGCPPAAVGPGLRHEFGLPHRLETIAEVDGVLWVNDSKATNVAAATAAVRAFDRPIIMMLGGRHKGEPYASIAEAGRDRLKAVVAFGEAAPKILAEMEGAAPYVSVENGMDAAVRAARRQAEPVGGRPPILPSPPRAVRASGSAAAGESFARAVRSLSDADGSR